ncbi:hypothetical protein M407DRAFT_246568, partial [Tulasnella calospora MUT 4182]
MSTRHFYRYYDELADEIDEDLVKSLKAQLDGILIFAGLFAGVNSAFLALTLPQLSADPADDTNALLLQIALGAAQPYHCCTVTRRGSHYPCNVDMRRLRSMVPIQTTVVAYNAAYGICDRHSCCRARNQCHRDAPSFHITHHWLYVASDSPLSSARRSMGGHPEREPPQGSSTVFQ